MRHTILRFAAGVLAAAALVAPASGADLAIVGATLYPSPAEAPIADGALVIHDGRIAALGPRAAVAIPRGATLIDGRGRAVTAGFWNSHVHLLTPELLHARDASDGRLTQVMQAMFTRWGFTTVFDIGSVLDNTNAVRVRIASGKVAGPQVLTVGDPFFPKGGTPIYVRRLYEQERLPSAETATPAEAVARVDSQVARGADGIKIFAGAIVGGDTGVLPMDVDLARAIVAEAHKAGRPVFAHPSNRAGLEVSIGSGVDILAHTTSMGGPWDQALIARLLAHHMALIPTLTLFEVEAAKLGLSAGATAEMTAMTQKELGDYWRAGGEVLFGTDEGYTDAYDTTEEYRLMAQAGLDWRAILASLTVNPAGRFGQGAHKGRLAAGMDGDVVLLAGDPARDVRAFASVEETIRAGRVVYSAHERPVTEVPAP